MNFPYTLFLSLPSRRPPRGLTQTSTYQLLLCPFLPPGLSPNRFRPRFHLARLPRDDQICLPSRLCPW